MKQRWIIILLLALCTTGLHLQLQNSRFGRRIEHLALDLWFNIRGAIPAPDEFVLAAIDEISYQELDVPFNEAWPRKLHARLIERLSELNAKRVVFDVLFLGSSSDIQADKDLAHSMTLLPVVIGADSILKNIQTAGGISQIEQALLPKKDFALAAKSIGLVGFKEDDERVRHFYQTDFASLSHLSALAEAAVNLTKEDSRPSSEDHIKYYGSGGKFKTVPISEILNADIESLKPIFENKIVFVGLGLQTQTGPAQKDNYFTPFYKSNRMYGYEIHATAAANLLHKDWIKSVASMGLTLLFAIAAFIVSAAIYALRPGWAVLVLIVTILSWGGIAYTSFLNNRIIPGLTLTGLILPLAFVGSTLYYYLYTHSQQRKVEKAFQFYLSPDMARQMRTNPDVLKLGGENIYGTALFTDIANFTDITEHMLPHDAATMLNRYFTEVMEVIFKKEGTLIKYIGDAVFVIWGAPIKIADHAQRACETALAIQEEGARFNATKRFPPLLTRVGIHSGPMLVGNLGSERRFDYTAVGDTVNVASRTEGINKYFGTSVLITESVLKQVREKVNALRIGSIKMVGKNEFLDLHTITPAPLSKEISDLWAEAIKNFSLRKWVEAEKGFDEFFSHELLSKASRFYVEQIKLNSKADLPPEWRGEVVLISK